ncbi:ATP-binding protein [Rhodoplanes azumiensis]|uniref:histidine kinase n=1 Tax=Rhodoplanes azumiensis TaxID=1897628 RepID=A0ABW5AHN1_9BRAD
MRFPRSPSLSVKLPLVLSLVVATVAATIGAAMVYQDRSRLRDELEGKALLLARSVAVTTPDLLLRGDTWTLYKVLRQITQGTERDGEAATVAAMVLDPAGLVLSHLDPAAFPIGLPAAPEGSAEHRLMRIAIAMAAPGVLDGDGFVEGVAPVQTSGRTIGIVRVQVSTHELDRATRSAGFTVLLLTLGMTLVGSLIGAVWSIRAVRPLRTLALSMERIGRGEVTLLPVSRRDEIGQLVDSFNRMAVELDEKRRLAAELAANEKVIALGRIAAGVAHEVNNPLAGMLNCLSTLRAKANDPELVAKYLPLIEKGLRRIGALVKDLLIELRVEDAREPADPSCLEDIRDLVAAEIDPTRITLAWDNGLQPGDLLNRPKMQQVLLNLMRNAVDAMPEGGRLACRFWGERTDLWFEVTDTGHGIEPANLRRIFDPFFTSRPNGTGLGLWIVLRLVRSMGGSIDVDSAPDRGTTFRIRIPRETDLVPQPA